MMTFHIITIFPKIFDSYFSESILKRAQKNKAIKIKIYDLRKWTSDKHKTVDDAPYGGGAGMILKIEPIYKALNS
ncbi:MAG TPA: tRNA (guanosine(37)-N1)-methyltransferase TrmD, partial [Candidatus Wolfebacteria bacterium]|nr:tRNA (guanosine(37)-N1)-methyltransferase TrmD [Candidatus Wolfebacteria bacterium]